MTFNSVETSIESGKPARLYQFRFGTTFWRYTSADRAVEYNSQTFDPEAIADDGVRQTGQTSADEFAIRVPADFGVVKLFRAAPPATEIEVIVWEYHHGEAELRVYFTGSIRGMRRRTPESVEITCQSDLASLERAGLRLGYSRNCTHTLYDAGCKASAGVFEVPGVVITLTASAVEAGAWGIAGNYFAGGYIRFPMGGGEFDRRGVELQNGSTLTIIGGTSGIALGMEVMAYPGCPRDFATCGSRFSNQVNYGGFPKIPGKSPFDGNPVF